MVTANILFYSLIVVGFYFVIISYWLVAEALFPDFIESCRRKYESNPIKSTGFGVILGVPVLAVALALAAHAQNPIIKIFGLGLTSLFIIASMIGSTGLCRQIGIGLGSPTDDAQPWRRVLRGGTVLGLTFALPFVGWFAVMPWTLLSGLGVFMGVFFTRTQTTARTHPAAA
jgi:hypothetical protein